MSFKILLWRLRRLPGRSGFGSVSVEPPAEPVVESAGQTRVAVRLGVDAFGGGVRLRLLLGC
ncbi:E3 ubiquitin-protein ligase SINAT5-like [Gossypium australe]|uniref:E3 ubiquitin-protein ligase SINAT5-like n=1 Tax=Gossypium australe TaxID=47621 RepID=A0A5B6W3X7_9ROSI|nr:E3 ubiquitin-protein ligase SINAT5-like [Gossypium australe]